MKSKIKEHLTRNEVAILLAQPNKKTLLGLRDFCILKLMILTGLRRAEICSLKRSNLNIEDEEAFLGLYGKGDRWRKIPIEDFDLITALTRYFKIMKTLKNPKAAMFYKYRYFKPEGPQPITAETIRQLVDKYVKKAGITKRITPHSLRHSFLTLALQAGADLATVKALAGHSNISTTSLYLHTTEELKRAAIKKLSL